MRRRFFSVHIEMSSWASGINWDDSVMSAMQGGTMSGGAQPTMPVSMMTTSPPVATLAPIATTTAPSFAASAIGSTLPPRAPIAPVGGAFGPGKSVRPVTGSSFPAAGTTNFGAPGGVVFPLPVAPSVLLDGDIADLQPVAPTTTAAPTLPPVPLVTVNPIDIERERSNARRKKILIAAGLLLIAGAGWYLYKNGHLRRLFGRKNSANSFVSNSN